MKMTVDFAGWIGLRILRMAGTLSLRDWVELVGKDWTIERILEEIDEAVEAGTVLRTVTRGGLVLYRWPEHQAEAEQVDEDELHERLYVHYKDKSFTISKASKALSLERGMVEGLVEKLVKSGRLKEQGMRKFMGHPFQTYKVV